ncbi:MAG TPA: DUF1329 domain-containing protein [Candidatus Binataceae bacterium]|nr:DUF1329 domain-containing protein [Candidatus Binataceae bacterium]
MINKAPVLVGVMLIFGMAAAARSQTPPAPAAIPPGTVINPLNWRQYKAFMSAGLTTLFEGSTFWKMPKDLALEVGPTVSIPLPKKYLEDTEKYSAQVQLIRLPTGGYVPKGYVAGLPFPKPLQGDPALIGQRIFWNSYYRYQPRVQHAPGYTYTLDRYGNMTQTSESKSIFSQLAFLSDVDFPRTVSDAGPYYFARYTEQIAPEQGKYSAVLDLTPADPTALDELYEYVPTLRKSLRLSQAARCAPVFGSDYLIDDQNDGPPGLPQLFEITYLGEKKILALEHANPAAFQSPGTPAQLDQRYYYNGASGVIPFPKPAMGKWELRDTYVISLKRLPQFAKGYCYAQRVLYIDKENYFGAGAVDLYGAGGDLYKAQIVFLYPAPIPGTTHDVAELLTGPYTGLLVNFRNKHATVEPNLNSCVNAACAKDGYLDVSRYASPEGLMKIVR